MKLGWSDDPPSAIHTDLLDDPTDSHEIMQEKILGVTTYGIADSKMSSQRSIPQKYQLIVGQTPFEDETYQATITEYVPKFECVQKSDGLRFNLLKEVEKIREYLLKRGNKRPDQAIPINNLEVLLDLFNLNWNTFKLMSWNDLVELILQKYWQFGIEETDEVLANRVVNSLSKTLNFKGPYQSKYERMDNFEAFILWIKDFKMIVEDYGLNKPLLKSIKDWWRQKHNAKCLPANVRTMPLGEDPKFIAWITNHRGPLTFTDIKNWIANEAHTRDDIAKKSKQSLLPQMRAVLGPKAGAQAGVQAGGKGKVAAVVDSKVDSKDSKASVPPAKNVCKEKCLVCGPETNLIHWAVSADGTQILCPAALKDPKKYEGKIKDVMAKRKKRIETLKA